MHAILHRLEIEASPQATYQALTTAEGLSAWWTQAKVAGDIASFAFGPNGEHKVDMSVIERVPDKKVVWRCQSGPWESTTDVFSFEIDAIERGSALVFANTGWQEAADFYMHCNCKWGFFLAVSLKSYLETGTGKPHPQDPDI